MYVPNHFRLPDEYTRRLLGSARAGNLVTCHDDGPDATMVPFFHDAEREVLVTHLVRNNPQATRPVTGPAMVVLDEADAYVSPRWYATNDKLPNVPTWDYITVHVWGTMRVDPSPAAALAAARRLTEGFEGDDVLERVGQEKLERMARSIVAVEVAVERVEGKAKMSQNRHPDDIRSLIQELESQGQETLVDYLRTVSLPHAQERHALISELRGGRAVDLRVSGTGS
ncbi:MULTISPECIES: FMN-binding negative transcriptional regulator [unclassified Luteococcus]|uniref:FMN-binding negative transcriptional regulator n=1 Tax=unclassified Luteococcus TaxID=2639923 RepID=UPI00313CE1A3